VRCGGLYGSRRILPFANHILSRRARQALRGYGNAPDGLGCFPAVERGGTVLMGELVDLATYKRRQEEKKEIERLKKEQEELDQTLDDMAALKRILEDLMHDLPDASTSIMYVPIDPKPEAFMMKDLDGYLDTLGLKLDDDETDET
jgi:hypothetical protein